MRFFFMKPSCDFWSSSTVLFSLYFMILFCDGQAALKLPENVTVPALIAFGDSIVDQGNNNYLNTIIKCNFSPYGKDFMGGEPTGRFTNAKTPSDLIAEQLGIKENLPAYFDPTLQINDLTTGVSFASGGSGFDTQTSNASSVLSMSDQLELFKEYIKRLKTVVGEKRTNYILANTVYLVVAGSDDLANTYFTLGIRRLQYDVPSYAHLMVASASNFIREIYKLGARRIPVLGVPPLGCLPSQRTLGGGVHRECVKNRNKAARLVNSKLSSELQSLKTTLPHSKIAYIDIYKPLLDIIRNPQNYGIEVVDRGCCGTGELEVALLCNKLSPTCPDDSKYLFWDSYHPTEKGYKILVDIIIPKYINQFL